MTSDRFERIYRISAEHVADTSLDFKRYLYGEMDWSSRLICIKGPRGVGKTTLMLQRMREALSSDSGLYVSLDNIWVDAREVYSLAEHHLAHGGTHLFLDEVHKAENWQNLLKSLYDDLPRLHIVYSGSSLLRMESCGGDLSRRQDCYFLPGLSFREYLRFEGLLDYVSVPLERILSEHVALAREITGKLPVLKHFDAYLRCGYYPFYRENPQRYARRTIAVVNQVLEVDYPEIDDVERGTVLKARRMLDALASSSPLTPNMSKLYGELGTDRKQGLRMLYALEQAGLLSLLGRAGKDTLKSLPTPGKIYCDNPNLMVALVPRPDTGTLRESFFLNALRHGHEVSYPTKGDFLVDGKLLFEVGGPGKGFGQIAGVPDSYVAYDDVEIGIGNKIPLWLFGFLY